MDMIWIKAITKKANGLFVSVLLFFFYLLIVPFGTVIFKITQLFIKTDTKSFWIHSAEDTVDLESSY